MARNNKPIFIEPIEAWKYGPVVPKIYSCYKNYGNELIKIDCISINTNDFISEDIDLLMDVYDKYGKYSYSKLIKLTHKQGSLWQTFYEEEKK